MHNSASAICIVQKHCICVVLPEAVVHATILHCSLLYSTFSFLLCMDGTILCILMCNILCTVQVVPFVMILTNLYQHYCTCTCTGPAPVPKLPLIFLSKLVPALATKDGGLNRHKRILKADCFCLLLGEMIDT